MSNAQIADSFSLLAKLMDINGENSFKAKSYVSAAFNIERLTVQLSEIDHSEIFYLKGIGESNAKKIIELLQTGELKILQEIIEKTPTGVIEMLQIKGIGPKKINAIWKEMEIENIGELQYACKENRLKLYKGFGEKTQKNIEESIDYYLKNKGVFLFSQTEMVFFQIKSYLEKIFFPHLIKETGAYRRQDLIIPELEFVVNVEKNIVKEKMLSAQPPALLDETETSIAYKLTNGLIIRFYTGSTNFTKRLFVTTGSSEFLNAFENNFSTAINIDDNTEDDEIIFNNAGIQNIVPALREKASILTEAKQFTIPTLIQHLDVKGIIHSHSNWSDGNNTIEEMAKAAIGKGFEYLVLSDHSKSAFYANGLNEEKIKHQHQYIDELNTKLAPFKIFKSIECDILYDGNLDYSNSILSTFDLVITSIHSILKMTEEKAMTRLLTAIENPYTTILGHLTGRLLLSREGYPINHFKIIDACASNHVAIEINAHPSRLDIDWKYIDYAVKKNVLLSINPDAHFIEGFDDIRYGVLAAQKGMLTKENNLSSFTLDEFEIYLKKTKQLKQLLHNNNN